MLPGYLPCTESTIALTFSNLASGGMAQPIAMMKPSGPTSVEQAVAVGLDLVDRAQRQHRRGHVAQDAHVPGQDLLGPEDVGLAVELRARSVRAGSSSSRSISRSQLAS